MSERRLAKPEIYNFGPFTLDVDRREIRKREKGASLSVHLRPQAYDLLVFLIRNRDRAVTKEEAWSALQKRSRQRKAHNEPLVFDVAVVDQALRALRRILGEDPSAPIYIKVPGPNLIRFIHAVRLETGTLISPELGSEASVAAQASRDWLSKPNTFIEGKVEVGDSGISRVYQHDELNNLATLRAYSLRQNVARAIRLTGAGSVFFPPEAVHMSVSHLSYELPSEIKDERHEIIKQFEREAKQVGSMFWDGPNTRLVDFRVSARDSTEKKHLELTVGPVGWYDYTVVHEVLKKRAEKDGTLHRFVNLEVVSEGDIRAVRFTNTVTTITALLTLDGSLLYVKRGRQVSSTPGKYSGIAENIHPEWDLSLIQPSERELPSPFKTVVRGIQEEISRYLCVAPSTILLLGMDFNLDLYHPDILFAVALPYRADEVFGLVNEFPGEDYVEGTLRSIPANRDAEQVDEILAIDNWDEGGKACVIRTLEFLHAVERKHKISTLDLVKELSLGNSSWINAGQSHNR